MLNKALKTLQLIKNMGWRYVFFRTGFEFKKRTGLLQKSFPVNPEFKAFYTLEYWRQNYQPFFFSSKDDLKVTAELTEELKQDYKSISDFKFKFFSGITYDLGSEYNWITNPDTGFCYDANAHWVAINDYSTAAGDIKYVWEPSRFSHLYTLIRYDKYSGIDCAKQVFDQIANWISLNKINQGPNFKCSQEISLRVLNWTFALYYYRNSPVLTPELFAQIQHYIYWQLHHVYHNINFSRIAVRNNHAITETLALYIIGTLFPSFPYSKTWRADGKRWFEQEVAYQVYEDGTFLQFSMNYHRVVVQLLTWGIRIAELNNDTFSDAVYDRAKKSLKFLTCAMDTASGWLPNYGANDGALFFKLSDNHYRDYRPQLQALSNVLGLEWTYGSYEDVNWYGAKTKLDKGITITPGLNEFKNGGYYIYRTADSMTFIRCGNHKDRPSQADNLHVDIWYKGKNILHDAGSYKYNATSQDLKYFMGTASHNTVMLDSYDQMEKGSRFIWYYWTQCEAVKISETAGEFRFEGTISAFRHISAAIKHTRIITLGKNEPVWKIEDIIANKPNEISMKQLWHTLYPAELTFANDAIEADTGEGAYSSYYGKKEPCTELSFVTNQNHIKTTITML